MHNLYNIYIQVLIRCNNKVLYKRLISYPHLHLAHFSYALFFAFRWLRPAGAGGGWGPACPA